jgi:hypothetical protein
MCRQNEVRSRTHRRAHAAVAGIALLMALVAHAGCGGGQSDDDRSQAGPNADRTPPGDGAIRPRANTSENPLLRYIPPRAVSAIIVRPKSLAEANVEFPFESQRFNSLHEELNYEPREIEQFAFVYVGDRGQHRTFGAYVIRLAPGVTVGRMRNVLAAESGVIPDGEKNYWEGEYSAFYFPDERTIVRGDKEDVQQLMAEDRRGPLRDWLVEADGECELIVATLYDYAEVVASIYDARSILRIPVERLGSLEQGFSSLPAGAVDKLLVEVRLGRPPGGRVLIQAADESLATDVETLVRASHEEFTFASSQVRQQIGDDLSGELGEAVWGLLLWIEEDLAIGRDGQRIEIDFRPEMEPEQFVQRLNALARIDRFSDASNRVDDAFDEIARAQRLGKPAYQLKQIATAMRNYHANRDGFPPAAIRDSDDRPLLSWRVALLPFLDEQELYSEFHLDEPWDSPHNRPLVEKIPLHFRSPWVPPGHTRFLVFTGEGTPFASQPLREEHIRDGEGNTIMVVEAGIDRAVPWTQPQDLELDPRDPLRSLGDIGDDGFRAVFFDGSVQTIPALINDVDLWRLINPSDGERLQGFIPGF